MTFRAMHYKFLLYTLLKYFNENKKYQAFFPLQYLNYNETTGRYINFQITPTRNVIINSKLDETATVLTAPLRFKFVIQGLMYT